MAVPSWVAGILGTLRSRGLLMGGKREAPQSPHTPALEVEEAGGMAPCLGRFTLCRGSSPENTESFHLAMMQCRWKEFRGQCGLSACPAE